MHGGRKRARIPRRRLLPMRSFLKSTWRASCSRCITAIASAGGCGFDARNGPDFQNVLWHLFWNRRREQTPDSRRSERSQSSDRTTAEVCDCPAVIENLAFNIARELSRGISQNRGYRGSRFGERTTDTVVPRHARLFIFFCHGEENDFLIMFLPERHCFTRLWKRWICGIPSHQKRQNFGADFVRGIPNAGSNTGSRLGCSTSRILLEELELINYRV